MCNGIPDTDLKLPQDMRGILRDNLDDIISGDLPQRYLDNKPIITVGDVVTDILVKQGIIPDVAIVDGKTQRGIYKTVSELRIQRVEIENPTGMITKDAWKAIEKAISDPEPVLIHVDGEEDLLSIPSIILCPEGGTVIYGIPSKGMVVNVVDDVKKEICLTVIDKMIEV